jgi:DNA-binding transcriptional ArsR family regulator
MPFEPRELTDARAMRALTHPVRLALMEALAHAARPITATEAGRMISESATTCSFHLRQLAKYGFVEEAGRGAGRRRPWRLTSTGVRFSDAHDDPEAAVAAATLGRAMRDRWLDRARASWAERETLPAQWRDATGDMQYDTYVTPSELRAMQEDVLAVITRYHERARDPSKRPDGSRAIEVLALFYPLTRPQLDE